jgi:hypothetical protein
MNDVRTFMADDLIARLRVHLDRDLIRHRAAWHKDRRLFAQHLREPPLQRNHRRVISQHIIAHLRASHRLTHAGSRLGHSVAAKINRSMHSLGHDA